MLESICIKVIFLIKESLRKLVSVLTCVPIGMLQEDFLKWKGSLFFRFIMAIVDETKEIKEFGK